jgi:hypothetical protein
MLCIWKRSASAPHGYSGSCRALPGCLYYSCASWHQLSDASAHDRLPARWTCVVCLTGTCFRSVWQEDGEDHKHDERVTSVSIEAEGQLHPEAINMWLQARPTSADAPSHRQRTEPAAPAAVARDMGLAAQQRLLEYRVCLSSTNMHANRQLLLMSLPLPLHILFTPHARPRCIRPARHLEDRLSLHMHGHQRTKQCSWSCCNPRLCCRSAGSDDGARCGHLPLQGRPLHRRD